MRTYEIINAGPKNRFMANGRIVSNSGRLIQLQNLPQNHISTLNEARELVKMGCFDMVESIYGNTPDILSQLIRTMLIPKPGCEFIVADFSAIEARVLAWLAREQWRLDAFKRGEDIYCASASHMFGVPVEKHGINGELRQRGKVAELACVAEGQLVLTDHGEIPIEKITPDVRVWDGEEWVSHEGVVYRGEREVIRYKALTVTPDHLVLLGEDYIPFDEVAGENAEDVGIRQVYDIMNCGSRHRFSAGGFIVHNCGYGGGKGALISMGALDMGLTETELSDLIDDWRSSNPNIVRFWWEVEKAAKETVKKREERAVGRVKFQFSSNILWIVLPSGRKLAYIKPRLMLNKFERESITFESLNAANKWERQETYGGRLTENIIQATARDLLSEAMWRMEQKGLDIVGHVHDEVILEVPMNTVTVDDVCKIMNQNPYWAEGLPLSSDGYKGAYYFKS